MDKLKGLLKQMGASDELVGQLIGEMNAWKAETEKSLNEAYESRLAKAKKVCFEEVTRTKAERQCFRHSLNVISLLSRE